MSIATASTSRGDDQVEIKYYIVVDLEFNRPNNRFRSKSNGVRLGNEIIQIGAVKLDIGMNEIDSFECKVKPKAYLKVNSEVKKLTKITNEEMWAGKEFRTAMKEFLEWCGNDAVLVTWSDNDIFVIEDNMRYHGMSTENLPECYDIQIMFDDQVSMNDRCMPLNYAMWKLGIKPAPAHDALNDAFNTVEVFRRLDLSEGLEEYAV